MGTKISVQTSVLDSLSKEYRKYGDQVSDTYKTVGSRVDRELESVIKKYSDYYSVTSKAYELQSQFRRTAQNVRVLWELSDELSRGLKNAVEQYAEQTQKEKKLIGLQKVNIVINTVGNKLQQGAHALSNGVQNVVQGIGKKADAVYSTITDGVSEAVKEVKVNFDRFQDEVKQTVVSVGQQVKNKLNDLAQGMVSFFKKTKDTLVDLYGKFTAKIKELFEQAAAGVQKLIDYIVENKDRILDGLKKAGIIVLDTVQFLLDIAGLIPVYGEIADGLNALIYLLRKDYVNAGLSLAACIPIAGWAATGGKIGSKIVKLFSKVDVFKVIDKAKDIGSKALKYGETAISFITKKGNEVWSFIQRFDIVKKVDNLITAISKKGYEIQTKIYSELERFKDVFGQYWEAQSRMGIVPPSVSDFLNRKPKVDIDPKKVDVGDGIGGTGNHNEAWEAIDRYRRKIGLEPLGDKIPVKGDGLGTIAFTDVNGKKVFGINSSVLSDSSKDLGRDFFKYMKSKGFFSTTKNYGQGASQVLTHAETHSLMRAWEKTGGNLGDEVILFVDRLTCSNCKKYLPDVMDAMGIKKLTVLTKSGDEFIFE